MSEEQNEYGLSEEERKQTQSFGRAISTRGAIDAMHLRTEAANDWVGLMVAFHANMLERMTKIDLLSSGYQRTADEIERLEHSTAQMELLLLRLFSEAEPQENNQSENNAK